jgi:hypothetical protein
MDSIRDFTTATGRGQSEYKGEVKPMKASQVTPSPIHSSGVARVYIEGLHDSFIPTAEEVLEDGTEEQAAIANDCLGLVNTNIPTQGMATGNNGSELHLTVHAGSNKARGGVWNNSVVSHLRQEGPAQAPGSFSSGGIGSGNFGIANQNWGSGSPVGASTGLGATGKRGKFIQTANRQIGQVKHVVLHVTQGSDREGAAQGIINWFARGPTGAYEWKNKETGETITNPPCADVIRVDGMLNDKLVCKRGEVNTKRTTSIHYATDKGGNVVQGGEEKDIAWHVDRRYNSISIGIEMCGFSQNGPGEGFGGLYSRMYPELHLETVAKLVAEICHRWKLPANRDVIVGHEELAPGQKIGPGANIGKTEFGKRYGKDTGNYWNWSDFMSRVKKHYQGGMT